MFPMSDQTSAAAKKDVFRPVTRLHGKAESLTCPSGVLEAQERRGAEAVGEGAK